MTHHLGRRTNVAYSHGEPVMFGPLSDLRRITRRRLLIAALLLAPFSLRSAIATPPADSPPISVALPDFLAGSPQDSELARAIPTIIAADLASSGLFVLVDTAGLSAIDPNSVPRFPDWRVTHARALVTGRIARLLDGRLTIEFRLWDVAAGQHLAGVQYVIAQDTWRTVAHVMSDQICERLSGQSRHFE